MQYSIVNLSEVKENSDFRIDAEYWKPENYVVKKLLNECNSCRFEDKIDMLTDYHANGGYKMLKDNVKMTDEKDYALMIRTVDLENENYENNVKYISENAYNFLKKTKIFGGEIIINKVGSPGSVFRMPYLNKPVSLGMNQFLIKIKDAVSDYIFIFLKTKYGEKLIKQRITGAVPQSIDKDSIRSIPIFIPSQSFQQSVAVLVDMSYIFGQSANTLYKETEEILLEELGLKNYQPQNKKCFVKMLSNTQEAGRIDAEYFQPKYEDIIDKIKKYNGGYDILENISKIKKCIEPGSSEYKEDGIPFIRVSNLDKFGLNAKNQQYISEAFYKKNIEHQPQKGEILLSKDGSLGIAYCLYHEPKQMICSSGIVRLIENKIEPLCLALVLNSIICQMQIEKTSGGALIAHWLVDDIKNLIVPLLPQAIQSQISAKIQQSFESREKSKQLFEVAKRAVEIAIEENEEAGLKYIEENK